MEPFASCKAAINEALTKNRFAIAHLCNEERTMDMHIHDCYEIYYSITGAKQFLIDNRFYDIQPGDLFVINNYESHYVSQVDNTIHERIVISIAPEFLSGLSTSRTDLKECFQNRDNDYCHKLCLDKEKQNYFLFLVNKINNSYGYGADIVEETAFAELMILINSVYRSNGQSKQLIGYQYNQIINDILQYINRNIQSKITISLIANEFYFSTSYLCRLFKSETGVTINKYIASRRISIAKAKLAMGCSVSEACELSGFNDYTNFVQTFTKTVGMTPKKYCKYSNI